MKKDDEALFAKVRDIVAGTLSQDVFDLQLDKLRAANGQEVSGDVPAAVQMLGKSLSLTEAEQSTVLDNFIKGGNLTRWGMSNAVTLASQDVEDYDRATELERAGGRIIEMATRQWDTIAQAEAA
jgi:hypothetical protein